MIGIGRLAATLALLSLAGCSGGLDLDPFNWFGGDDEVRRLENVDLSGRDDPRALIVQVTSLAVEDVPGGIILRATGVPPTQGYHSAGLTADAAAQDGVLSLAFRAVAPPAPQPVSTVASREIVVGYYLTDRELDGVRSLRVRAGRNALEVRR